MQNICNLIGREEYNLGRVPLLVLFFAKQKEQCLISMKEWKLINCVCLKRITLCDCLCSSSCCFSPSLIYSIFHSLIQNIGEFGAKSYFTDYQTANTIHSFRDSFLVLKIHGCYKLRKNLSNFPFLSKRYNVIIM